MCVQAVLSKALGGRGLDRHLDADEAAVLGASYFAANLTNNFRLRKFGVTDLAMFGVDATIEQAVGGGADAPDVRPLLPCMRKLPARRTLSLSDVVADPVRVGLSYRADSTHGLPPGVVGPELAAFVGKAIQKWVAVACA